MDLESLQVQTLMDWFNNLNINQQVHMDIPAVNYVLRPF